jgi:hypothetical protein
VLVGGGGSGGCCVIIVVVVQPLLDLYPNATFARIALVVKAMYSRQTYTTCIFRSVLARCDFPLVYLLTLPQIILINYLILLDFLTKGPTPAGTPRAHSQTGAAPPQLKVVMDSGRGAEVIQSLGVCVIGDCLSREAGSRCKLDQTLRKYDTVSVHILD